MDNSGRKHSGIPPVSRRFDERLRSLNNLDEAGFKEWIFHPAMLFGSLYKWWGDWGRRDNPHEGLDLCLYRTVDGGIRNLGEKARVPTMFGGEVMNIIDDFLGKSVFIHHSGYEDRGSRLYTIYGHIEPGPAVTRGEFLREGEVIGAICGRGGGSSLAHLHISVAWISDSLPAVALDWKTMGNPAKVVLLDPLSVISCRYSIVETI
ncbi:MAG: peptidoglycan DD-metalloendopeptidase family protein [Chloroflexi bacterium]|nr:peptidoglycan DD-metalloendopeptidase family protein [Chloroflexota bacterium]